MIDWNETETRVTDPVTGGQKGQKSARLGSVDPLALYRLAQVSGDGAAKYAAFNYLKGYDWSLSFDALMRHLLRFWSGEDRDDESGHLHVVHAAWHALALASFVERGLGTDDRYKEPERPTLTFTWSPSPETETSEPKIEVRAVCRCGWQSDWTFDEDTARERWHDDHADESGCTSRYYEVQRVGA